MDTKQRKQVARKLLAEGCSVHMLTAQLGYKSDLPTHRLIAQIKAEDEGRKFGNQPRVERGPDGYPLPQKQAPSDAEDSPSTPSVPPLGAAPAAVGDRTELDLLTEMLESLWPDAQEGKLGAIDRILKIQQRRAELGAGASASRQDVVVKGEVSNVDKFLSRLAERSAHLPGRAAS